jgi:cell division protein FtsI (penicillin-binding protein 3)
MQQVLAYLNVSHDASINDKRRLLLRAANAAPESEIADGASERLGDASDETMNDAEAQPALDAAVPTANSLFKPAAATSVQAEPLERAAAEQPAQNDAPKAHGTAVLDVDGGVTVPSLIGLPVRNALETASAAGLELEIVGSGVAREQSPPAGSHVPPGGRISVRFAR